MRNRWYVDPGPSVKVVQISREFKVVGLYSFSLIKVDSPKFGEFFKYFIAHRNDFFTPQFGEIDATFIQRAERRRRETSQNVDRKPRPPCVNVRGRIICSRHVF